MPRYVYTQRGRTLVCRERLTPPSPAFTPLAAPSRARTTRFIRSASACMPPPRSCGGGRVLPRGRAACTPLGQLSRPSERTRANDSGHTIRHEGRIQRTILDGCGGAVVLQGTPGTRRRRRSHVRRAAPTPATACGTRYGPVRHRTRKQAWGRRRVQRLYPGVHHQGTRYPPHREN